MEASAGYRRAAVIDHGTLYCRAGFAGEEAPRSTIPTVVGRPFGKVASRMPDLKDFFIGSEALLKSDILSLKHPIQHGMVDHWDDMVKIWEHIYKKTLRVDPRDQPVLLTESPLVPKVNREKMTQVLFETFSPPSAYIAIHQLLFLYSSGKLTGLVYDCGENVSYTVPVYHGYALASGISRHEVGGQDLTNHLLRMLNERGYQFYVSSEIETARKLKKEYCYVAQDFHEELEASSRSNSIEKAYELPDGRLVKLRDERIRCPEALFQPQLLGSEAPSVQKSVQESIDKINSDIHDEMYGNIMLSGGSTMFTGMQERLTKELEQLTPSCNKVCVSQPTKQGNAAWIGGSVLASLSTFQNMWMSKQEYDEHGPSIVHKKCEQVCPT